ncbi:hypothetical protein [Pseudomonas psychrophila]|uniref:Uncharacterized protein n=1 Tax=Pseudomonas psychrophila TaxID=122355 RepID=A0A8I1KBD9_9PSED|nr:hypothetical protein [Pseudomonas psychrophila]AVX93351.1 hypothetical protein PkP19E3_35255 [Pseudomonas koreensis]MBJ2259693.1 hypothetical protein [Pseudomonas psychrophila]
MNEVDCLIAGLEILKKYKPAMSVYASSRARLTLETQENEFGDLAPADRARLLELGWETNECFVWRR